MLLPWQEQYGCEGTVTPATLLHCYPNTPKHPPVHKHAKLWVEALSDQQLEELFLHTTLINTFLTNKLHLQV